MALAGVINEHTRAGLAVTLGQLTAGHQEIHISLRDVASCELAGLRAIIGLTGASSEAPDDPARQVVLHDVPGQLTSILQILGWDRTPGLVIAKSGRRRTPVPRSRPAPHAARRPGSRALAFARARSSSAGQWRPRIVPGATRARCSGWPEQRPAGEAAACPAARPAGGRARCT